MTDFYKGDIQLNTEKSWITTIDSHTEGEATRLIVDGLGTIPGDTMMQKLDWFKFTHDPIRNILTKEPRGPKILAAAVTKSVSPDAAFGLIYMDAKRYPYLCGHATIGAVVTLAKTGFLKLDQGENRVGVDTPSGRMEACVTLDGEAIISVTIEMVPSFVYKTGRQLEVEGFGTVPVDIVCTGGFFAMVESEKIGIPADLKHKDQLIDLGMKIIDAANEQIRVSHPVRPNVNTVDVTEFYDSYHEDGRAWGRGMVIYGESHADRSPCGTGTAAKLALLHNADKLGSNESYINYSPLGTSFRAKLVKKKKIGNYDGFVTQIEGMAYITGIHHFFVENHDPFQQGFIL